MLQIRQLDVGDHPPLKAADEACLQSRNIRGWPITREHDLATRFVERVECVKELFLRRFLALEKLHVVDEQEIGFAKAPTELVSRAILNGSDELVRELLRADEGDPSIGFPSEQLVRDRLHEVGLTDACIPVDEQRVVNPSRRLSHGMGGRSGELVRLADNEVSKGVAFA